GGEPPRRRAVPGPLRRVRAARAARVPCRPGHRAGADVQRHVRRGEHRPLDGRRPAEAGDILDGAVEAARLIDDDLGVAWGLFNRAAVALHEGNLDGAVDMARESVELSEASDKGMIAALGEVWLGMALLEAGDARGAVDHMQRSGGELLSEIPGGWRVLHHEHLLRAHLALGDLDA